jgi:hypothetical protein
MSTTEPTEPTDEDTTEEDEVAGHRLANRRVAARDADPEAKAR